MKNFFIKKSMIYVLLGFLFASQSIFAGKTKVAGEIWMRYTLSSVTNFSKHNIKQNSSEIARGYLTFQPKLSDMMSGRFTIDVISAYSGKPVLLKYAYLTWQTPVPDLFVDIGLAKNMFGMLHTWDYTVIGKDLVDRLGYLASADMGVQIYGFIPMGFGNYSIGMSHGEGYKKDDTAKHSLFPAYMADLNLIPLPGVSIGGSYLYDYVGSGGITNKIGKTHKYLMTAYVKLSGFNFVTLYGQYLQRDQRTATNTSVAPVGQPKMNEHYMTMLVLNFYSLLEQQLELIGKVDYDKSTEESLKKGKPDGKILVTAGINYTFDAAKIQLNYTQQMSEVLDPKKSGYFATTHQIDLQLVWKFSSKIVN